MSLHTPVVFIVFRRPELTVRVLERIREAEPERLWVIADGPRRDHPSDARHVAAVRQLVGERIDWPCDVRRIYADHNLGCAQRVSSGLDAVFSVEKEAIILEDDCLPHITFFRFCEELLAHFRNESRVGHIGGCHRVPFKSTDSYYFSHYNHVWGWATWQRAWNHYDFHMTAWRHLRSSDWLLELLGNRAAVHYWRDQFDNVTSGHLDSWAFRWTYSLWKQRMLSVIPYTNLITNIGFDKSATHTKRPSFRSIVSSEAICFPLRHPPEVSCNPTIEAWNERHVFSGSFAKRCRRSLRRILRRFVRRPS